jgi:hypothetical protein
MPPLSFDDAQMNRLMDAAALLPPGQRDAFLRSVAGRVAGMQCIIGMAEIESAIEFTLNAYGVIGGLAFKGLDKAAIARRQAERSFK